MSRPAIISFSKDWLADPTSNYHVMRELSHTHRVLWLNSVGTRSPSLTSRRDLTRIFTKLGDFLRGPQQVDEDLWVFTPIVLPLPTSPTARRINRWILRKTIRLLRARLNIQEFDLWTFFPAAEPYVGSLGESLAVYYCTDEYAMFSHIDNRAAEQDRALTAKSDVVFAVVQALKDSRTHLNRNIYLATHGVDHEKFSTALETSTPIPADVASLPGPILGFYGTIEDWVDQDLIRYIATRNPEWSIVLIGPIIVDTSRLDDLPNVHLLGRKPHDELPGYCKAFSVALIPYVINERMPYVNPIKLREYLSAGCPVVSTDLPEARRLQPLCRIACSPAEFEAHIAGALAEDTPEEQRARSQAMASETWRAKVDSIRSTIESVRANGS